jgi:hypothetical protein
MVRMLIFDNRNTQRYTDRMKLSTAEQVATRIKCSKCTVHRWALRLNVGRLYGITRLFSDSDVSKIKSHVQQTAGNPDWINSKKPAKTRVKRGG